MRLDRKSDGLPLTSAERFFASAWLNMVHEHSLDSYRVRLMNPRSAVRELLTIWAEAHANKTDRAAVASEALEVLEADQVLRQPRMRSVVAALVETTKSTIAKEKDKEAKDRDASRELALQHYGRELGQIIDDAYLSTSLSLVEETLVAANAMADPSPRYEDLAGLTGNLISTLVDTGWSLESLYQLYVQILAPRVPKPNYQFRRKFALFRAILEQPKKEFRILFAIDNVTSTADFPQKMGDVTFGPTPNNWPDNDRTRKYLIPNSRRLFAEVTITSFDVRMAGEEAYRRISSLLDLTRFEYEREHVQLSHEYLANTERPNRVGIFAIPRLVPNPMQRMATRELENFVGSVENLLSRDSLSKQCRNRVLAAFRLYRTGADHHVFEPKIVSWWTAVEYLTRGGDGARQIAVAVESALTPTVCLPYLETLLLDLRETLAKKNREFRLPVPDEHTEIRSVPLARLALHLRQPASQAVILQAMQGEPYLHFRIQRLAQQFADAPTLARFIESHEKRVRWQIQRQWRARCAIVHNGARIPGAVLLSANLEFYLKTTLLTFLGLLGRIPTLSSPEEFFDRRSYAYQRLLTTLKAGSTDELDQLLA